MAVKKEERRDGEADNDQKMKNGDAEEKVEDEGRGERATADMSISTSPQKQPVITKKEEQKNEEDGAGDGKVETSDQEMIPVQQIDQAPPFEHSEEKAGSQNDNYFKKQHQNDSDQARTSHIKDNYNYEENNQQMAAADQLENFIRCEIKDLQQFSECLESVKFPKQTATKNQFNDVILQAHHNGIVLKSASNSGVIMTRCMIRTEFFTDNSYHIDIRNEADKRRVEQENEEGRLGNPLIEFCLPISELKQIVDGIIDEGSCLAIEYPTGDNYLQVEIPEETTNGQGDKICTTTKLQLETFEAQHTLNPEFNLLKNQNLAQIFGKVQHFKKALKEFSFLQDKEVVELRFSESYPHLQFIYGNEKFGRYHVIKFNQQIDDLVYKKTSEASAFYTIESLRLAFSRISSDSLLCIVTLQNEGYLSVKHMHQQKLLLIESIILAQEDNQDEG